MAENKKLGRYELRSVLGKGAMGVVYEGFDPALGRQVAIKTILKNAALDVETERAYSERFTVEAKAVARLNHSNIVQVYDFGVQGDVAYLVMEFIRGRELRSFFDANERFEAHETVRIMGELLDALQFAHTAGVIHRDVKPANVMLDAERRVKLADFGVARVQDSDRSAAGTMVGTPAFMSPEQISGGKIDRRTDLFSAGVVLYQLLTGEQPFKGKGAWTVAKQIMQDDPPQPSTLVSNVSPAFDAIVDKALAKKPADRFADAKQFAAALRAALEGLPGPLPMPNERRAAPSPARPAAARKVDEADVTFWQSIENGKDPSEIELYLRKFPNGTYADLARHKLERLRGEKSAAGREATVPIGNSPLSGAPEAPPQRKPVAIGVALLVAAMAAGVIYWQGRAPEQAAVIQIDEAKIRRETEERVHREFAERAAAAERLAAAKEAGAKATVDKAALEKAAAEREAAEKAAVEKAVAEKLAAARATAEKAAEKAAAEKTEKIAAEKAAAKKLAEDKALAEKLAAAKSAAERAALEKKAALDRLSAEKAAAEKAAEEKAAATRLAEEKAATERAAAEKLAAEKAAAEKAVAAKAAAAARPGWPNVGDKWTYEVREPGGAGGYPMTVEVLAVGASQIRDVHRPTGHAPVAVTHHAALLLTAVAPGVASFAPYLTAFREPRVGDRLPDPEISNLWQCGNWLCSPTARIVGKEKVTVRAGTFEAWKIEVAMPYMAVARGTAVMTYWYSEQVKRTVKYQLRVPIKVAHWSQPDIDMELVSYTPAK